MGLCRGAGPRNRNPACAVLSQAMCPGMGLGVCPEERVLFVISTKVPFELVVALALSGHSDSQRYCRQGEDSIGGSQGLRSRQDVPDSKQWPQFLPASCVLL